MEAQQALRRMTGTGVVLVKQLSSASAILNEVRSMMEDLSYQLPGSARRDVLRIQRQCEDWQHRNDSINIEAPE